MASRPLIKPFQVITNGNMGSNITSTPTIIDNISMISYDISWAAGTSPVGTLSVEVSNTYSQNADGSVRNAGNWTTLVLATGDDPDVSGNSGHGFIDVAATGANAIRLVYSRTGGQGTMQAYVSCKVM